MTELEEIAKSEDASAHSEPAINPPVSGALNTHFSTPRDVHEYTTSSQPTDNEPLVFSTSSPVMGLPSPGDVGMKVA